MWVIHQLLEYTNVYFIMLCRKIAEFKQTHDTDKIETHKLHVWACTASKQRVKIHTRSLCDSSVMIQIQPSSPASLPTLSHILPTHYLVRLQLETKSEIFPPYTVCSISVSVVAALRINHHPNHILSVVILWQH